MYSAAAEISTEVCMLMWQPRCILSCNTASYLMRPDRTADVSPFMVLPVLHCGRASHVDFIVRCRDPVPISSAGGIVHIIRSISRVCGTTQASRQSQLHKLPCAPTVAFFKKINTYPMTLTLQFDLQVLHWFTFSSREERVRRVDLQRWQRICSQSIKQKRPI